MCVHEKIKEERIPVFSINTAEGLDKFFGNSSAEKILKIAAEHFGGLYAALVVMVQIGYKIQLAASLTLAMWMIPLTYAATKIALPEIMKQVS